MNKRGSALLEFAMIFPIFLLTIIGGLDLAIAAVDALRLTYTTQAAASLEARAPGTATPWAKTQFPQATFAATLAPCGAQVTASLPLQTFILPIPALQAQACWP